MRCEVHKERPLHGLFGYVGNPIDRLVPYHARSVPTTVCTRREAVVGRFIVIPCPSLKISPLKPSIVRAIHLDRILTPTIHALSKEPGAIALLNAQRVGERVGVNLVLEVNVTHGAAAAQLTRRTLRRVFHIVVIAAAHELGARRSADGSVDRPVRHREAALGNDPLRLRHGLRLPIRVVTTNQEILVVGEEQQNVRTVRAWRPWRGNRRRWRGRVHGARHAVRGAACVRGAICKDVAVRLAKERPRIALRVR